MNFQFRWFMDTCAADFCCFLCLDWHVCVVGVVGRRLCSSLHQAVLSRGTHRSRSLKWLCLSDYPAPYVCMYVCTYIYAFRCNLVHTSGIRTILSCALVRVRMYSEARAFRPSRSQQVQTQ